MVTPSDRVAAWSACTAGQVRTQRRLLELGVDIVTTHALSAFDGREAVLICAYTGRTQRVAADAIVMVTARLPIDGLYRAVSKRQAEGLKGAPRSLRRIGDCEAPAIIAAAVFSGHRYARELDGQGPDETPARHECVTV